MSEINWERYEIGTRVTLVKTNTFRGKFDPGYELPIGATGVMKSGRDHDDTILVAWDPAYRSSLALQGVYEIWCDATSLMPGSPAPSSFTADTLVAWLTQ